MPCRAALGVVDSGGRFFHVSQAPPSGHLIIASCHPHTCVNLVISAHVTSTGLCALLVLNMSK